MANTKQTIVAAYRSSADAQAAAADLQTAGINRSDIFIESSSTGTAAGTGDSYASRSAHHEGGVVGWFKSLFGDEETEHTAYQQTLTQGGYLVSVDAPASSLDSVETILNRHNPINVSSDTESSYSTGTAATAASTTAASTASPAGDKISVLEEDLQVGKRSVLRGGVRVFSRVVETPVEESIGLREERVTVNRQAVNRPATEADFAAGRNQSVEVEEYGEEAVVAKQARVVEEIEVGKQVSERTETVKDTLRHTEVEVEQLAGDKTQVKTTGV